MDWRFRLMKSILYVVASRAMPNRLIRAFDVVGDGRKLANNRVFIDAEAGTPDGFRVDIEGNLWCGWGMGAAELDGVRVFDRTANPIGHIALPERAANLCFGGRFRNRLFMAASHGLYALYVNTQGVAGRLINMAHGGCAGACCRPGMILGDWLMSRDDAADGRGWTVSGCGL